MELEPYEQCVECGRKSRVGREVGFYSFPGEHRALCQPFTGRNCARKQYQRWRAEVAAQEDMQSEVMLAEVRADE